MILADTRVIVAFLRSNDRRLLNLFTTHGVAICGVTRAEVLYGVRSTADKSRFVSLLNALPQASIPDALWDHAGLNLAALRTAGYPLPVTDVVIATLAIQLDVELWAYDQHFEIIQNVIPALRLFQEPP